MNKILFSLILTALLLTPKVALPDGIKISQLPLGSATSTGGSDSLPYVDAALNLTKRLTVWDLSNVPTIVSTYAPKANPVFTGTLTGDIADFSGDVSVGGSLQVSDDTTLSARLGIVSAGDSASLVTVDSSANQSLISGATQIGVANYIGGNSSGTSSIEGFRSQPATQNSSFTAALLYGFNSPAFTKGAASTITRAVDYSGFNQTVGTNNAFIADNSAFTGDWFINQSGSRASSLGGLLGVTGNFAVNTNKFNVTASSGNTSVAGTLGVTGDVAVSTNKFNVTASSGNTSVAGTFGVTGITSLGAGITPLKILGDPTSATQMQLGSSSNYSAIGTERSSGTLFFANNAQYASQADSWTQNSSGSASLLLDMSTTGLNLYGAASSTANGTKAAFWGSSVFSVSNTGAATVGSTLGVTGNATMNSQFIVATSASPASNAACTAGRIVWDASFVYVCTASTVWKRAALTGGY